ncbi:EamA family transporter [Oscillatoria sp. FACHB-1407]|uniref:EamA family transporter n=1 Tax=Oscillatoria sp. FACHB-1407 TaxID=2692847 RepID=UPI0018F00365|nr:EamA family transporter [Oscillatoria sp. FACHB-1407]
MSILSSVAGQFFLKAGALRLGKATPTNALSHIFNIATTPELIAGLMCYGLGAIAYILLLTRVKLSIAGPSIALVYIFTVLMGYFFFKEAIPPTRVVGLGFIIGGVLLVMWQR